MGNKKIAMTKDELENALNRESCIQRALILLTVIHAFKNTTPDDVDSFCRNMLVEEMDMIKNNSDMEAMAKILELNEKLNVVSMKPESEVIN